MSKETKENYHSNKNRVFVRAIAGAYNLKDELARLRALPQAGVNREICRALKPKRYKLENYGR